MILNHSVPVTSLPASNNTMLHSTKPKLGFDIASLVTHSPHSDNSKYHPSRPISHSLGSLSDDKSSVSSHIGIGKDSLSPKHSDWSQPKLSTSSSRSDRSDGRQSSSPDSAFHSGGQGAFSPPESRSRKSSRDGHKSLTAASVPSSESRSSFSSVKRPSVGSTPLSPSGRSFKRSTSSNDSHDSIHPQSPTHRLMNDCEQRLQNDLMAQHSIASTLSSLQNPLLMRSSKQDYPLLSSTPTDGPLLPNCGPNQFLQAAAAASNFPPSPHSLPGNLRHLYLPGLGRGLSTGSPASNPAADFCVPGAFVPPPPLPSPTYNSWAARQLSAASLSASSPMARPFPNQLAGRIIIIYFTKFPPFLTFFTSLVIHSFFKIWN